MTPQTATPLEVLAAVFNIIGTLAAGWMCWLTIQRYRAMLATGGTQSGPRGLAAWRHVRSETRSILYHLVSLALGAWAMTLPDGGSLFGLASMWSRFLLAVVFSVFSVMDLLSDSRLAGMLSGRPPDPRGPA